MITDGTVVCGLCGEWRTGCSLCGKARLVDRSATIRKELQDERDGEAELYQQERAIRAAAEKQHQADF